MPIKVIVDTDTGIDDAMGCVLALNSPELEVVGMTSVFGNVSVELTTENTAYVLELFDRTDIPLARGAAAGFVGKPSFSPYVHGDDGVGNANFPKSTQVAIDPRHAAQLIVDLCRANPGQITIIALGPLTNVALALAIEPRLPELCPRVVWMGGVVYARGNVTPVAEADAWHDPEGAQIVLQQRGWRVDMVGLDVTEPCVIRREHLERLQRSDAKAAQYVARITPFYMDFYSRVLGEYACAVHSALTVAIVAQPELVLESVKLPIQVELTGSLTRGMTVADRRIGATNGGGGSDWRDVPLTHVPTKVDDDAFRAMFLERLTGG
ncbi:nucleoside hydrolase [Mesorhizobium sp. BAC0120]|uniref:nucleoside hydrolase n=1 Tax=Mesorhizobium sp. BAC0120 TaxID=3090670 RepID=UPI00298CB3CF|nr:nucleoside hydrolase [Mesorhizobium sp. BAC0120]MDW6021429.1 nucleoside hydrolase [Mesorhizobium sp. BAC0120]